MAIQSRSSLPDLSAFLAIVRHRSFTAAAIELGVTTSALSHRMRRLEGDLEVRLLNRSNRAVEPTPAGAALAERLAPGFETISDALGALDIHRRFPVGRLRLNVPRDAARLLLAPVVPDFIRTYPQIHLDVIVDDRPVDLIGGGFDAGVRYHDYIPGDMVATSVTGPLDWVVVAAPALLERVGRPKVPQDLLRLPCIQMRVGDSRAYPWELGNGESMIRLDVAGPLSANDTDYTVEMALRGTGFAYCLKWRIEEEIRSSRLEIVLPDWTSQGAPFAFYYPSRRQPPPGLRELITLLRARFREGGRASLRKR